MLTAADLEVNVLDFRERTFQFERLVELPGGPYGVFTRTETESERQLRPKLLRLTVVAPLAWISYDEAADALRVSQGGPPKATGTPSPVEVAAEPPEFEENGLRWKRTAAGAQGYVYVPADLAGTLLAPEGRSALGIS